MNQISNIEETNTREVEELKKDLNACLGQIPHPADRLLIERAIKKLHTAHKKQYAFQLQAALLTESELQALTPNHQD